VFRGVGVNENVTLMESLFVKYLKVVNRERCVATQELVMVSAATLWQRIARIRISKAISALAFDAGTCRLKHVTPERYMYGVDDDGTKHVAAVSSCPLEAFEAALLVFNLTRNTVAPPAAAATLNCARRIQALVAACAPENIFAHFTGAASVPFGVELVCFLTHTGNKGLLAHLFLKTTLLCDSATVVALKTKYASMPDGDPKQLLFHFMRPLLQTAESIATECASVAKKIKAT
jgi:hypothetical protein